MALWGLIRTAGEVALAPLLFWAGRAYERRDRQEDARGRRIEQVADQYVSLCYSRRRQASELRGFMRAGAKRLQDDAEIRECVSRILSQRIRPNDPHPLGRQAGDLWALKDLGALFAELEPGLRNLNDLLRQRGITPE